MTYIKPNPNGQATMANSAPVAIASDQTPVPVSTTALPLPAGAATEATAQAISALADSIANLTAMLAANMPRVTATKQTPVSIEGGSVGISTNQTLATVTTVTNLTNVGGVLANGPTLNAAGLQLVYNNIQVS